MAEGENFQNNNIKSNSFMLVGGKEKNKGAKASSLQGLATTHYKGRAVGRWQRGGASPPLDNSLSSPSLSLYQEFFFSYKHTDFNVNSHKRIQTQTFLKMKQKQSLKLV